jgi:hypothetical protein
LYEHETLLSNASVAYPAKPPAVPLPENEIEPGTRNWVVLPALKLAGLPDVEVRETLVHAEVAASASRSVSSGASTGPDPPTHAAVTARARTRSHARGT